MKCAICKKPVTKKRNGVPNSTCSPECHRKFLSLNRPVYGWKSK